MFRICSGYVQDPGELQDDFNTNWTTDLNLRSGREIRLDDIASQQGEQRRGIDGHEGR